jgi:hypothetical protein
MWADVVAAVGGGVSGAAIAAVCAGCVRELPVDGAAISVIGRAGQRETLFATDPTMAAIESVQFTLREGPCVEAVRERSPVLVPDLGQDAGRWPVFASELTRYPVGAVFAFPVQRGSISFGALDLYRREPGCLAGDDLARALRVVDLAAIVLLSQAGADDGTAPPMSWHRTDVHQATGMIIAALGVPADRALWLLRAHAFTRGELVEDVARAITTRTLDPVDLDT